MEDDQQFCLRWNNHQSTLISVFDTLLENQTLVDCTLAAEGQFLKAHKVVLSACSPFFATLLQQQYDKHPIFILKDVKYQELRAMMDYMYRGEVNISQDQLAALLKAAESLQIKGLSDNRSGSTPKTEQHRGLNVPGSGNGGKLSGYTLEQTQSKRSRVIPSSMETADISGSREGSSSPSRRRRKVRRRSIENTMTDVHDNSNSSQMNQSALQPQQQPQSNASLSGVGPLSAATSSLPVSASTLSSASSGVLAATGSIVSTQGTQQITTNITKKTESVKGASDAMNSENIPVAGVPGTGDDHSAEHVKGEKSNHKQKPSTTGVATKETADMVIEPKSEYDEEGNEGTVEDLTLDDEEMGMEDLDQNAGTSQAGEGSSQGYAPWQHDRSQDDLLMAPQEAQQRDPQGTSDGYWTILETVPYSLQNTATNTAGTITRVSSSHLPVHNQSLHQQDDGNSAEGNLLTSATVVVEIPTESMRNAIKYTLPEAEHQLIHTTDSPQRIGASGSKQRIHIVKDMRLNPSMTVSQQSTLARCNVEHPNRQSIAQQHSQQHFTLNDCLNGGVVVQQSHTEIQESAQQQTEYIKIESIQDKMMLRNVIQYDSVAVASSSMDILPSDTSQVINEMVGNEKQQHHIQLQPTQTDVLRNSRQIELLDKATIEAVSGTVLDAFNQQIQERDGDDKSHSGDVEDKLVSLMRCPAKIVTPTTGEGGMQLQYVCNLCGKSYKIKGSLKRHKRYECGVAPTVACNFCPHKCKYKSDLRKHVTQKHSGQSSEEHLMDH